MKSLILYYSRTGNTANVAQALHKAIKSDIEEVKDRKDRSGILGYLSSGKDALFGKEADIESIKSGLKDYNNIFIGGPVWALRPSTPVSTLIKRLDLKGKKVVLFVTYGGNPGKALEKMSSLATANGGNVIYRFVVKTSKMDAAMLAQASESEVVKFKETVIKKRN